MKVYRIDLTPYKYFKKFTDHGAPDDDDGVMVHPKGRLIAHLFSASAMNNPVRLMQVESLAQKLEATNPGEKGFFAVLTEAEYALVKTILDSLQGYVRMDVEWLRRVLEAQIIEVKLDTPAVGSQTQQ